MPRKHLDAVNQCEEKTRPATSKADRAIRVVEKILCLLIDFTLLMRLLIKYQLEGQRGIQEANFHRQKIRLVF